MKKIALIALAAVSMTAFAQNSSWKKADWSADWSMKHGIALDKPVSEQSQWDVKKAVWMHINDYMLAGDADTFTEIFNRTPSNETWALKLGLANVLQQSLVLQTGYNNFELNGSGMALKSIIADNKALGPDTYTILDNPMPLAMDSQSRPQRFSTWTMAPNVDTNYAWTCKALTANLNNTQKAVLIDWFMHTNEANQDAVTRFVKSAINVHALNYRSALRGNFDW
ncbi:hypothetical protein BH11ARM2_BH11ARM2_02380 [soil metagenome]